jgi:hypothetical protein
MLRQLRLLAIVAAALVAGAAEADRAWATHLTTGECLYNGQYPTLSRQHIYRYGNPNTRGTTNKILFRDRTTGICVPPHVSEDADRSYAWSAAHVRLGFTTNDHSLSVGWHKYFVSGQERFRVYTQWVSGVQTITHCCFNPLPEADCMNHNEADVWRVSLSTGTYWGLYINCIDGNGYRHLESLGPTDYALGTVFGETGRFANTEVHMADEQTDLLFRMQQSPPTWVSWNDNHCFLDDASQWRSWKISPHAYSVDWGDQTCAV